jgi:hypothetical protein
MDDLRRHWSLLVSIKRPGIFKSPYWQSVVLASPTTALSEERDSTSNDSETQESKDEDEDEDETTYDFHDLLKAKSLHLRTPLQLVLPATTTNPRQPRKRKLLIATSRTKLPEPWNLFTALYYLRTRSAR